MKASLERTAQASADTSTPDPHSQHHRTWASIAKSQDHNVPRLRIASRCSQSAAASTLSSSTHSAETAQHGGQQRTQGEHNAAQPPTQQHSAQAVAAWTQPQLQQASAGTLAARSNTGQLLHGPTRTMSCSSEQTGQSPSLAPQGSVASSVGSFQHISGSRTSNNGPTFAAQQQKQPLQSQYSYGTWCERTPAGACAHGHQQSQRTRDAHFCYPHAFILTPANDQAGQQPHQHGRVCNQLDYAELQHKYQSAMADLFHVRQQGCDLRSTLLEWKQAYAHLQQTLQRERARTAADATNAVKQIAVQTDQKDAVLALQAVLEKVSRSMPPSCAHIFCCCSTHARTSKSPAQHLQPATKLFWSMQARAQEGAASCEAARLRLEMSERDAELAALREVAGHAKVC